MATTTNYSWSTPDDTALVKDGAAAIRTLGSSADTTVKALNPGTTAGDIDYYTTSTAKARVGIGTAGQVLAVNSGATAPEWITSSSGGMTLLSTTTLSGAATTISSISQSYNSLFVLVYGVTGNTSDQQFTLAPNASSLNTFTYVWNNLVDSANGSPLSLSGQTGLDRTSANNSWSIQFDNYTSTTNYKPFKFVGQSQNTGAVQRSINGGGGFRSNSAITSLVFEFGGNTFAGGTVLVYGVK